MAAISEMYLDAEKLKDEGMLEEAVSKLQEVLAQDENHVLSHLALAVVLGRLGRHEEAVRHGERACEIEPNDPFNFTAMSVTYQRAWQGTQNPRYIQAAEDAMAKGQALEGRR